MPTSSVSVVIPIWNESENIAELYNRLDKSLEELQCSNEIIFVDDGSDDDSFNQLISLSKVDSRIKVIRFTRNFGQHQAVLAGFRQSKGDVIVTLDADLQNPPEEIPRLVRALEASDFDIVAGWRSTRKDPITRKLPSAIVNWMIGRLTGAKLKDYGCMLRAYRRTAVEALLQCKEHTRFITVLSSWLGLRVLEIEVAHDARYAGASKYTFLKLLRRNLDVLTGFSVVPIQVISIIGVSMSFLGFLAGFALLAWRLLYGPGSTGLLTVMAAVFFLIGLQLLGLGILGEYVGRILTQVYDRPHYVIREVHEDE